MKMLSRWKLAVKVHGRVGAFISYLAAISAFSLSEMALILVLL